MPARVASLLLTIAYPVLVFFSITFWSLETLAVVLVLLGALRAVLSMISKDSALEAKLSGVVLIAIGGLLWWSEAELSARLYPVVINTGLLCWFVWSLIHPPTVIERIARLAEPDLPDYAVAYTRSVTSVWSLFFLLNGGLALYTSLYSSLGVWTLYNGFIAYLLMGTLFAIEYPIRRHVRRRHENGID